MKKKFDYLFDCINKLNDKIMEHDKLYNKFKKDTEKIKEENKTENNNKNIIYGQEKQENNELDMTMENLNKYFYQNKINYNNNQNNIDIRNVIPLPSFNEKYSKINLGGKSNNSQNKNYQTPNPEITDENNKKICYLNVILKCLNQILNQYFLNKQTIDRIIDNNQFQLSNEFLKYAQNSENKYSKENNSSSILTIIENTNDNLVNNYNLKNIISTIFDQLHKELKKEIEPINIDGFSFDNDREKDSFRIFLDNLKKKLQLYQINLLDSLEKKFNAIIPILKDQNMNLRNIII